MGDLRVIRKRVVQLVVLGFANVLGLTSFAQVEGELPSVPYVEHSAGSSDMEYAAIGPGEALDLATPMRFKPVMGIELGAVWLRRSTPDSFNFVFDQASNVLLNMNQMQGSVGDGFDTKLHFYNLFSDCKAIDLEMRFFQASDMNFDQTVTATQVIPVFFNAVPATPATANEILYESRVRSFETNLVARTPYRVRLLGGYRYFELAEDFNIFDNTGSTPTLVRSRTRNGMHGGQIGTEAVVVSNAHCKIWGSFKWAALGNDVGGNAVAVNPATGGALVSILSGTNTAHLLDFELTASLAITRSFSIYSGYQGLAAYGVGLATSQSRDLSIFAANNPIVFDDAQWHGFKLGCVATF